MRLYIGYCFLVLTCCTGNETGNPIPINRFYYPSFLAQKQNTLFVVNTNLDLQYQTGNILQIDLDTSKILASTLIQSAPGQFITNSDFSLQMITGQSESSISELKTGKTIRLPYSGPYFLALFPGQTNGLLGYLSYPINESWDGDQFSLVANQSEIQYFTFDPTQGFQVLKSFQIASCFPKSTHPYRRIARLGGITITQNHVYFLAEFYIDDSKNSNRSALKHAFLIRSDSNAIIQGSLCNNTSLIIDLTQSESAQLVRGFSLSKDESQAYIILDENPIILRLDLNQKKMIQRVPTCSHPENIQLSPDNKTLIVACPKANTVLAYNASDLNWFGQDFSGKGPLGILFNELEPNQVFISYQPEHQIGILQYENSAVSSRSLRFMQWLKLSR